MIPQGKVERLVNSIAFIASVPETFGFLGALGVRIKDLGVPIFWVANHSAGGAGARLERKVRWRVDRRSVSVLDVIALAELMWILSVIRPSIVYLNTPKASLLGVIASKLLSVPCVIYQVHGRIEDSLDARVSFLGAISEFICTSCANWIWPVALWMQPWLASEVQIRPNKVAIQALGSAGGVDTGYKFCPSRLSLLDRRLKRVALGVPLDSKVVGFVGRFGREKGSADVISCWNELSRVDASVYLLLVGGFETRYDTEQRVRGELKNSDRVRILPWVEDVSEIYAIMDVFIFPTVREGLPYAVIEACAMEIPVVTTPIAGCLEVLDGLSDPDFICKSGDWSAMVRAIVKLFESPREAKARCKLLRESIVRRYSDQKVSEVQANTISKLLEDCSGVVI